MTPLTTKKKEQWNWKQIRQVLEDVYKIEGSPDNWGVQVIYLSEMLEHTKKRLKLIKQFIK